MATLLNGHFCATDAAPTHRPSLLSGEPSRIPPMRPGSDDSAGSSTATESTGAYLRRCSLSTHRSSAHDFGAGGADRVPLLPVSGGDRADRDVARLGARRCAVVDALDRPLWELGHHQAGTVCDAFVVAGLGPFMVGRNGESVQLGRLAGQRPAALSALHSLAQRDEAWYLAWFDRKRSGMVDLRTRDPTGRSRSSVVCRGAPVSVDFVRRPRTRRSIDRADRFAK